MTLLDLPIHPRLVHFPIALLLAGAVAALIVAWRPTRWLQGWGFTALLLGWILTIPAVISGLIEKSGLEMGSAADQLADQHTTTTLLMWALFGLALYVQYRWRQVMDEGYHRLIWTALVVLAVLVLLIGGHLGGRLVFELGVGVGS